MFKPSVLCFAAFGALTACGSVPPAAPIESKPVEPVYLAASKGTKINRIIPYDVRSFSRASGKKTEVTGVPCKIKTQYYTADVVTPGRVNLPSLGGKTPPAELSCSHAGKTTKLVNQTINLTTLEKTKGSEYFGIVGVLVASATAEATTNKETSVYGYKQPFHIVVD